MTGGETLQYIFENIVKFAYVTVQKGLDYKTKNVYT